MTWARLDDRFHGNPKVMEAWHKCPGAVGLYVMGITYCAQHETDGFIAEGFVLMLAPQQRDRDRYAGCLVDCGLWHTAGGGWTVNGYLEFNPSRVDLEEKRRKDAERKARGRNSESRRSPEGVHAESARPDPTRPDPTNNNPPNPPQAGGRRGRVRGVAKDGQFVPSKVLDDVERALYEQMGVALPPGATAADAELACEGVA